MEVSRKHGSFDTRWPCEWKRSAAARRTAPLRVAEAAEALDWDQFSARHFRERARHDSEARSAYAAYKQGREWRKRPGLTLVRTEHVAAPVEPEAKATGTRHLLAALAAVDPHVARPRVSLTRGKSRRRHG